MSSGTFVFLLFFVNYPATTKIYTVLTPSFPTQRSSDLGAVGLVVNVETVQGLALLRALVPGVPLAPVSGDDLAERLGLRHYPALITATRSEEHTSELQSLMRISYAVFCLKKKKQRKRTVNKTQTQNTTAQK